MFALTMLVRLGRISEQDIRSTFAAFQKLDKNNDGVLRGNSMPLNTLPMPDLGAPQSQPDFSAMLPRQKNSSSLSETSALIHPLASQNIMGDERMNYMAISKEDGGVYIPRNSFGTRGMSVESMMSRLSDENWDDNP